MNSYTLHLGDCLEVMPCIPAGSIDAIIADWPYGTTACKWDSIIPLEPLWKECKRVIKPGGAIVLTASQPFTSILVMSNLSWFRYDWVWKKNKGSNFQSVRYQPFKEHESVCVFQREAGVYNPQLQERSESGLARISYPMKSERGINPITGLVTRTKPQQEKRQPSSVQQFNCEMGLHPTQKPVKLLEYLIKTYTNEGDLVLDNTFGSCSTGEACLRTGRRFIGIERDPGYFEVAQARLKRVEEELRQARIARKRQPYLMEVIS